MRADQRLHDRRSIRLKGHDYSQPGAYFVTICTQNRACLFGDVVDGVMRLNDAGCTVETEWNHLPDRFPAIKLDTFVTMPNHVHGIIIIVANDVMPIIVGAPLVGAQRAGTRPAPTVSQIIGVFKSLTTVAYINGVKERAWPSFHGRLWQRNFHDHVIRDADAQQRIREYIDMNPANWQTDPENPSGSSSS